MTTPCRIAWLVAALLWPVMLPKHVDRQRLASARWINLDHAEIQFVTLIRDGSGMDAKE